MNNKIINIKSNNRINNLQIQNTHVSEDYLYHIEILNNLTTGVEFIEKKYIINKLRSKINGYRQQDKKRDLHEKDKTITLDELINKLYQSRLTCCYCNNHVLLMYNDNYNKSQWTLDRINNYDEHSCSNCCVACLSCNLERRRINSTRFKFTKQLNIIKQ